MLKYPCLVLDHDDTVVRSESTVNYPAFLEALRVLRPGCTISFLDFTRWTLLEGFEGMCKRHFSFSDRDLERQFEIWQQYVMCHTPPCFPGISSILHRQRAAGGWICVVSHSSRQNIQRDYAVHFQMQPDCIFGWELGAKQRKPSPYPLDQILSRFNLRPQELLVVDDMKTGWDMAKTRDVAFAWAGWSRLELRELFQPLEQASDFSFLSPSELETFLFDPINP